MKQFFFVVFFLLLGEIAVAHPLEFHLQQNAAQGSDFEYEFRLTMPFAHFGEGHVLTGSLLVLLWASFFYTIYSLAEPSIKGWVKRAPSKKEKEEEEE